MCTSLYGHPSVQLIECSTLREVHGEVWPCSCVRWIDQNRVSIIPSSWVLDPTPLPGLPLRECGLGEKKTSI